MVTRCSNGVAFVVLEPEPSIRTGIRVDIYDGDDPNTLLAILPDTFGRKWTDPLKGPGSGTFKVYAGNEILQANPDLLRRGNIARFALDEVYRFAVTIKGRKTTQVKVGDDMAKVITVTGPGVLERLTGGKVYLSGGLSGDVERLFTGTAGAHIIELIEEAQARNALGGVTWDFTAAVDSHNAPYEVTLDELSERAGTDLLRVSERHAELAVDVHMTPALGLQYFNTRGVDRTIQTADVGPIIFQPGDNLLELERDEDGEVVNVLLIETPAGWLERVDGTSVTEHGRLEGFLSLGNVTTSDQVDAAAEAVFRRAAQPAAHLTLAILDKEGARAYVDWNNGDWVLAPDELGELTRYRIRSVTVTETKDGRPLAIPELATLTEELDDRLQRWLEAMARGTLGGVAGGIAEPVETSAEVVEAIDDGIGDHVAIFPHHDELDDLADVDTSGQTSGDVLRLDGSTWEAHTLVIDDLDDVDTTGADAPSDGDVLTWDDGRSLWVPAVGGGGGGVSKLLVIAPYSLGDGEDVLWDSDLGDFTQVTSSGTQTVTERDGSLSVKFSGQAAGDLNGRVKARTFTIGDAWATRLRLGGAVNNHNMLGLCFADGNTPSANCVVGLAYNGDGSAKVSSWHGTLENLASNVRVDDSQHQLPWNDGVYVRLVYVAANTFAVEWSIDGTSFTNFGTASFAKTMTPTHFGPVWSKWGGASDGLGNVGPLCKLA